MKSYGTSLPLLMSIEGHRDKFEIRPTVIDNLSGQVNIGSAFFTELSKGGARVSLSYINGKPALEIKGRRTEMIQTVAESSPDEVERSSSKIFQQPTPRARTAARPTFSSGTPRPVTTMQGTIVKGKEMRYIPVKFHERITPVKTVCVLDNQLQSQTEVVPGVYIITKDMGKIAVVNTGDEDYYIPRDTELSRYTEVIPKVNNHYEGNINRVTKDVNITDKEVQEILKDLQLDKKEILQDPAKMKEARKLIMDYIDVFATPSSSIGTTNLIEFEIQLQEDAIPVNSKVRPLNPKQVEDLKKRIEEWEREGVIEPADQSNTSWASPLVPVRKQNGETRWCCDFRALNKVTVPDRFAIPNIEQNLESLAGNKIFSCLDSASAYHAIKVSRRCRHLLTFVSPLGAWHFKRMPFGCRNSASCYSRFVQMALQNLDKQHIIHYLDDVVVASQNWKQHLQHLRDCLQAHKDAGLKLRAAKTKLFQEECQYLGYYVSQDGISMTSKFVERVLDWQPPSSPKELSSFLGFVNYYRSFIKDFSFLTNEMNAMRSVEKSEYVWTDVMNKKFLQLKEAFRKAPIRAFPRYDIPDPFELSVDFSKTNLGAVLTQKQFGKMRYIQFAGRKCTKHEVNYHSYKGEAAALIYGVRKFSHILLFKPFVIHTDCAAITHLLTAKNPRGLLFRWITELQAYDFTIKHRSGKSNVPADFISRTETDLDPPSKDEILEEKEYVLALAECNTRDETDLLFDNDGHLMTFTEDELAGMINMDKSSMIQAQKEDPILKEVRSWVEKKQKPTSRELKGAQELLISYAQGYEHLCLINDLLYDKRRIGPVTNKPLFRLVIPSSKYPAVFYWSHEHLSAAHPGIRATYMRAASRFYWPGLSNYIKQMVAICQRCLAKQTQPNRKDGPHRPVPRSFVGSRLHIDLVGPIMSPNPDNLKYILTMEDSFSRFVMLRGLKSKGGEEVTKALYDTWISTLGFVHTLHSDRGTEFTNNIMKQLASAFNIKLSNTPSYNAQSNSIERFHRTLNKMMRTYLDRDDTDWTKFLSAAALAHNTTVHSSTGLTPFFIMVGREATLPVDIVCPNPDLIKNNMSDHVKHVILNFSRMFDYVRRHNQAVIRRNANLYSGRTEQFLPGSLVWYLSPTLARSDKPRKITNNWTGPWKVTRKISDTIFNIQPAHMEGREISVNVNRLALCTNNHVQRGNIGDVDTEPLDEQDTGEIPPPVDLRPPLPVSIQTSAEEFLDLTRRRPGRPPRKAPAEGRGPDPPGDPPDQSGGPPPSPDSPEVHRPDPEQEVEPMFRSPSPPPPPPDVDMEREQESPPRPPDPSPPPQRDASPSPPPHSPRAGPSHGGVAVGHGGVGQDHGGARPRVPRGAQPSDPEAPAPRDPQQGRVTRQQMKTNVPVGPGKKKLVVKFSPDDISREMKDQQFYGSKHLARDLQAKIQGKEKRQLRKRRTEAEFKRKRADHSTSTGEDDRLLKKQHRKEAAREFLYRDEDTESDSEDILGEVNSLFIKIEEGSLVPTRGSPGSACYDLRASKNTDLPPHQTTKVPLKLKVQIPPQHFMLLLSRSGLSLRNVDCRAGVIDSDFRSELQCLLHNSNDEIFRVNRGSRVCQAIILPVQDVHWHEVPELDQPGTSHGGFGSTGV